MPALEQRFAFMSKVVSVQCQDFSVTQILREINFGVLWRVDICLFAHLDALISIYGIFQPSNIVQFHQNQNSETL